MEEPSSSGPGPGPGPGQDHGGTIVRYDIIIKHFSIGRLSVLLIFFFFFTIFQKGPHQKSKTDNSIVHNYQFEKEEKKNNKNRNRKLSDDGFSNIYDIFDVYSQL